MANSETHLNIASPVRKATGACSHTVGNWSCRGTGYLWLEEQEPEETGRFPCPVCNTATFLARAKVIAEGRHPTLGGCACCGPAGPPGTEIWDAALQSAKEANPRAAEEALRAIGRVKVFDEDSRLVVYTYPPAAGG